MNEMKDQNGNPLQSALYRGQRVLVDVSGVLLSSPTQFRIVYKDGRRGFALCEELLFVAENPLVNNPTEDEIRDRIACLNRLFALSKNDFYYEDAAPDIKAIDNELIKRRHAELYKDANTVPCIRITDEGRLVLTRG